MPRSALLYRTLQCQHSQINHKYIIVLYKSMYLQEVEYILNVLQKELLNSRVGKGSHCLYICILLIIQFYIFSQPANRCPSSILDQLIEFPQIYLIFQNITSCYTHILKKHSISTSNYFLWLSHLPSHFSIFPIYDKSYTRSVSL